MMNDEQFDLFIDTCYNEMEQKQNSLFDQYGLGRFERYWLDGDKRTLDFLDNDAIQISFKVTYIGTWAHIRNTWMWGWNNESLTEEIKMESSVLKELMHKTGYDLFNSNGFECDEPMAYELTATAINHLNAIGMYRIPGERSHLFLALIRVV